MHVDRTLYRAEDFASDESFISYYLHTDPKAVQSWEEWISHHPEKVDEILNAEALLALMYFRLSENELEEETARFEQFLLEDNKSLYVTASKDSWFKSNWMSMAAVVSIMVVFVLFYYPREKPLNYVTHYNGYGKILTLQLSDGSKVILNANSSLKMPKVFGKEKREVFLIGEAFFEVAKDKSRPFIVTAHGTKTKVLGTKFNVAAYYDLTEVKVALEEGSVELSANAGRDKMILKPSEAGIFSLKNKSLIRDNFDQSTVASWKTGLIIFNKASFNEIALQLHHLYGIKLLDQSGKQNWSYSAQFDKMDYISIIKSICFAENLTFKQTHQTIILNPKQ